MRISIAPISARSNVAFTPQPSTWSANSQRCSALSQTNCCGGRHRHGVPNPDLIAAQPAGSHYHSVVLSCQLLRLRSRRSTKFTLQRDLER